VDHSCTLLRFSRTIHVHVRTSRRKLEVTKRSFKVCSIIVLCYALRDFLTQVDLATRIRSFADGANNWNDSNEDVRRKRQVDVREAAGSSLAKSSKLGQRQWYLQRASKGAWNDAHQGS